MPESGHATRQHVLGRTIRPAHRPIRTLLVTVDADTNVGSRNGTKAPGSHENVRTGPTPVNPPSPHVPLRERAVIHPGAQSARFHTWI